MKKISIYLLAGILVASVLSGCGEQTNSEINLSNFSDIVSRLEPESSNTQSLSSFNESEVLNQISIVEEYTPLKSYTVNERVAIIKNNSDYFLDLTVDPTFHNKNGEIVGVSKFSINIEPGQEKVVSMDNDIDFETISYNFKAKDISDLYVPILNNLKYEYNIIGEKVIISATNTGDTSILFPQADVIFFKGKQPILYSSCFIMDNDSELKPKETEMNEVDCYEDFDSVKIFMDGEIRKR